MTEMTDKIHQVRKFKKFLISAKAVKAMLALTLITWLISAFLPDNNVKNALVLVGSVIGALIGFIVIWLSLRNRNK